MKWKNDISESLPVYFIPVLTKKNSSLNAAVASEDKMIRDEDFSREVPLLESPSLRARSAPRFPYWSLHHSGPGLLRGSPTGVSITPGQVCSEVPLMESPSLRARSAQRFPYWSLHHSGPGLLRGSPTGVSITPGQVCSEVPLLESPSLRARSAPRFPYWSLHHSGPGLLRGSPTGVSITPGQVCSEVPLLESPSLRARARFPSGAWVIKRWSQTSSRNTVQWFGRYARIK